MSKLRIYFFVLTALTLFCFFTIFFFNQEINRPRLSILGQVQPFTLLDMEGKKFGLSDLKGKVWVANFFFTTCSDICPIMNKQMASLNRSFDLDRRIALVSFSVNPETDTPQVLKSYAQKYGAKKTWYFLTGPREDITKIAVESFKLGDIKEPIFHSSYFTLVDKSGLIRGYYDGTKQVEVNRLFRDAGILMKEKTRGLI
jgi:protein SCO1/2